MDIVSYWKAALAQQAKDMGRFFHRDAVILWHNTNERFTVEEFIRANCEYPGAWAGEIERVETIGDLVITVVHVYALDSAVSCHVTSFIRVTGGKIAAMDEYWGDDGPPPQWRLDKQIGTAIR